MKKSKKPRPVSPCWCCNSIDVYPVFAAVRMYIDISDIGWWQCARCGATAQEKPTSLGPGPKVMPWGAFTELVNNLYTGIDITARSILETTRKKKLI